MNKIDRAVISYIMIFGPLIAYYIKSDTHTNYPGNIFTDFYVSMVMYSTVLYHTVLVLNCTLMYCNLLYTIKIL